MTGLQQMLDGAVPVDNGLDPHQFVSHPLASRLPLRPQLKVVRSIVGSITVQVMHRLSGQKISAQNALHDDPVNTDAATESSVVHRDVATLIDLGLDRAYRWSDLPERLPVDQLTVVSGTVISSNSNPVTPVECARLPIVPSRCICHRIAVSRPPLVVHVTPPSSSGFLDASINGASLPSRPDVRHERSPRRRCTPSIQDT